MSVLIFGINEKIDFPFTFIDRETLLIVDPASVTIEIYHMEASTKVIDLAAVSMIKIDIGKYTYEFTIPDTFIYGEIYNALITSVHPTFAISEYQEQQFIIRLPASLELVRGHFTRD